MGGSPRCSGTLTPDTVSSFVYVENEFKEPSWKFQWVLGNNEARNRSGSVEDVVRLWGSSWLRSAKN
jgi:hypothetical protein